MNTNNIPSFITPFIPERFCPALCISALLSRNNERGRDLSQRNMESLVHKYFGKCWWCNKYANLRTNSKHTSQIYRQKAAWSNALAVCFSLITCLSTSYQERSTDSYQQHLQHLSHCHRNTQNNTLHFGIKLLPSSGVLLRGFPWRKKKFPSET
jgi:hypothetical protein